MTGPVLYRGSVYAIGHAGSSDLQVFHEVKRAELVRIP